MHSVNFSLLPVGFFIGFLTNSLGGGGGALFVGVLTAFFNVPGAIAASSSLATVLPTTLAGSFSHWRNGNIRLALGIPMAAGGVAGAVGGSLLSSHIPPSLYQPLFAALFVYVSVQMLLKFFRKKKAKAEPAVKGQQEWIGVGYGVFGGVLSGVMGISGTPPILVGLAVLGYSALHIIGTSVFVLTAISAAGFLTHLRAGDVQWAVVLPLAGGSILGGLAAPWVVSRVKKQTLEAVYQPIILILTLSMTFALVVKLFRG